MSELWNEVDVNEDIDSTIQHENSFEENSDKAYDSDYCLDEINNEEPVDKQNTLRRSNR